MVNFRELADIVERIEAEHPEIEGSLTGPLGALRDYDGDVADALSAMRGVIENSDLFASDRDDALGMLDGLQGMLSSDFLESLGELGEDAGAAGGETAGADSGGATAAGAAQGAEGAESSGHAGAGASGDMGDVIARFVQEHPDVGERVAQVVQGLQAERAGSARASSDVAAAVSGLVDVMHDFQSTFQETTEGFDQAGAAEHEEQAREEEQQVIEDREQAVLEEHAADEAQDIDSSAAATPEGSDQEGEESAAPGEEEESDGSEPDAYSEQEGQDAAAADGGHEDLSGEEASSVDAAGDIESEIAALPDEVQDDVIEAIEDAESTADLDAQDYDILLDDARAVADHEARAEELQHAEQDAIDRGDLDEARDHAREAQAELSQAAHTDDTWFAGVFDDHGLEVTQAEDDVADLDAGNWHEQTADQEAAEASQYLDDGDVAAGQELADDAADHYVVADDYADRADDEDEEDEDEVDDDVD
ncbi:MAG: hypothetical protein D6760_03640 [Deltaproteobacteria bacterium]|nr:MAG: hypothetical protein D6760_03640 [Deltaproteobacteria bacterium]